jgi:hypothetical protein
LGDLHQAQDCCPEGGSPGLEAVLKGEGDSSGLEAVLKGEGESPGLEAAFQEEGTRTKEGLEQIRLLADSKKWRRAIHKARGLSPQSVRVLNIQGCLYALRKQYGTAARFFAQALAKDRVNPLALAALPETAMRGG